MNTSAFPANAAIRLVAASLIAVTAAAWHAGARAQADAVPSLTQSSAEQGVTLKVTPKPTSGGEWEFTVVFDTHSQSLTDDLLKTAVLVADGREIAPAEWTGAAPGGHHREGVLKFAAITPAPAALELRIQRPGETAARVFRWDAAALR